MRSLRFRQRLQNRRFCRSVGLPYRGLLRPGTAATLICRTSWEGADAVVKQGTYRELRALELWQDAAGAVEIYESFDRRTFVMERLGPSIGRRADYGAGLAAELGEAVASVHGGSPDLIPADTPRLDEWISAGSHQDDRVQELADETIAILTGTEHRQILLHADLLGGNALQTRTGALKLIDPFGYWGGAAYDLTRFATMNPAADPLRTLKRMLDGYGSRPPLLPWYFACTLLVHYANLVPRHPQLPKDVFPLAPVHELVMTLCEQGPEEVVERALDGR